MYSSFKGAVHIHGMENMEKVKNKFLDQKITLKLTNPTTLDMLNAISQEVNISWTLILSSKKKLPYLETVYFQED